MTLYQRVQQAAHDADPRVVLATAALAPLYALGWLAGRAARLLWRGAVWLWHSLRLGALDGWGSA